MHQHHYIKISYVIFYGNYRYYINQLKFLYKFPNEVTNCKRTEVNCRSWLIQWTNVEHDWYRAIAITVEICLMISYSNEWVFLFNINLFDIDMFNLWLLTDWLRGHSVSFIIISLKTFMKISISKIFNRNLFNISYIYIKKKKKKKECKILNFSLFTSSLRESSLLIPFAF